MTIRRLALAAAAMAAAWMFALSLPAYADSHEESEKTEESAEKEHEEKEEAREAEHENGDEHEEAKRDRDESPEALRDRVRSLLEISRTGSFERRSDIRSPEALREHIGSLLREFYGLGDEDEDMRRRGEMAEAIRERLESIRRRYERGDVDEDMRRRGEMAEAIRERMEALRRVPAEQLREQLIEQTKQAMREKIEKSPEEGHEIELDGEKRIREIKEMSEEKLRAVFMEQLRDRLRKGMGETDQPNRMGAMMFMRRNRMGGTARWNMRKRVNINRMNRQTGDGDMRFEAFHLEHIPAQHAAEMVDPFMPKNTRIAVDPRTNKLLVMASGHGMRIAMDVLREVDIPVEGEREKEAERRERQREMDEAEENRRRSEEGMERGERDRRSGALPMPMYDYESRRQTAPGDPRAGAWPLGGDIFNPYMPANRIEGVLTEKGEDYIAVQIEGIEEEMRARLPIVRVGDTWTVKGNLASKIKELNPGDAVILEWWEAEGVLYLHDIARLEEKRRERVETYLFE